jgi:hypothetical protein
MKTDANGLIVTQTGDGGDTCAEEGRFWFLYWFNFVVQSNYMIVHKVPRDMKPGKAMNLLEISPGVYVRNPLQGPNNNDPRQTSRDQLIPIIFFCAAYKDYKRLGRLFLKVLSRGMFAQNSYKDGKTKLPDQMITTLGYFIRAGGMYTALFYPLLLLFDSIDLLGCLIWLLFPYTWNSELLIWNKPSTWLTPRSPGDVDDNNHDIIILGAYIFKPTLISELHRFVWGRFRPSNLGNALLESRGNNCLAAMAWYHSIKNDGNPEITELYTRPILQYMKK